MIWVTVRITAKTVGADLEVKCSSFRLGQTNAEQDRAPLLATLQVKGYFVLSFALPTPGFGDVDLVGFVWINIPGYR